MEKILKALKDELGELYEEFIEIMRKDNVIISGSFILNLLTDRNYKESDIDIYCQVNIFDNSHDTIRTIYSNYHKSAGSMTTFSDLYYYMQLSGYNIEKLKLSEIIEKYPNFKIDLDREISRLQLNHRYFDTDGVVFTANKHFIINMIKKFNKYKRIKDLIDNNDDTELFCVINTKNYLHILNIHGSDELIYLNECNTITNLSNIELLIFRNYWPHITRSDHVHYEGSLSVKDYCHRILSNKCILQIILSQDINHTINNFDFSNCKNYLFRDIDGTFHLHIENISNDIIVRDLCFDNSIQRIIKYKSRGFNIIYEGENKDYIKELVEINNANFELINYSTLYRRTNANTIRIKIKPDIAHIPLSTQFITDLIPLNTIKFIKVINNNDSESSPNDMLMTNILTSGINIYYGQHCAYFGNRTFHENHIELPSYKIAL